MKCQRVLKNIIRKLVYKSRRRGLGRIRCLNDALKDLEIMEVRWQRIGDAGEVWYEMPKLTLHCSAQVEEEEIQLDSKLRLP